MTISKLTVVYRIWINQRNFVKTQVRVRLGRGKSFLWKSKKENVPNWPQDCGLLLIKQDFQRSYGKLRLNILKFDLYAKYSRTYKTCFKIVFWTSALKASNISPPLPPTVKVRWCFFWWWKPQRKGWRRRSTDLLSHVIHWKLSHCWQHNMCDNHSHSHSVTVTVMYNANLLQLVQPTLISNVTWIVSNITPFDSVLTIAQMSFATKTILGQFFWGSHNSHDSS